MSLDDAPGFACNDLLLWLALEASFGRF